MSHIYTHTRYLVYVSLKAKIYYFLYLNQLYTYISCLSVKSTRLHKFDELLLSYVQFLEHHKIDFFLMLDIWNCLKNNPSLSCKTKKTKLPCALIEFRLNILSSYPECSSRTMHFGMHFELPFYLHNILFCVFIRKLLLKTSKLISAVVWQLTDTESFLEKKTLKTFKCSRNKNVCFYLLFVTFFVSTKNDLETIHVFHE